MQTAWWAIAEVAIGPFGSRHCFGGECRETGLAWTGGSELWMRSAVATRAAGYIAMFLLIMFAGAIAAKREPKIVARGCLAAIVTAIATGAYFYIGYHDVGGASIAAGFLFYVGAIVAGIAAIVLFLRRARH